MFKKIITSIAIISAVFLGNEVQAEDKKKNFDPSMDFKFEFIIELKENAIFIENTEKEEHNFMGDWAANTYKEKGGKIEEEDIYKVNPKLFEDVIINRLNDKYTLIMNNKIMTLKTEGFYYEKRLNMILVKLIPETPVKSINFREQQLVVIKQPHPKIETVKISPDTGAIIFSYDDLHINNNIYKMVNEKFAKFAKDHEYFLNEGGNKTKEIFIKEPQVDFYLLEGKNKYQLVSATWQSDLGETSCCLTGLFELKKEKGRLKLEEIVSLDDGRGTGGLQGIKLIQLNQRDFVHMGKGGWEWGWEVYYEIKVGVYPWELYIVSKVRGD